MDWLLWTLLVLAALAVIAVAVLSRRKPAARCSYRSSPRPSAYGGSSSSIGRTPRSTGSTSPRPSSRPDYDDDWLRNPANPLSPLNPVYYGDDTVDRDRGHHHDPTPSYDSGGSHHSSSDYGGSSSSSYDSGSSSSSSGGSDGGGGGGGGGGD